MTTTRPVDLQDASATSFRLPDIPQRHPDDMTSVEHLHEPGQMHHLSQYLGNLETTLVTGERYVVPGPAFVAGESRYPDLLVAFDVNPAAYKASNGYIVSEQGKPPDFILEVASRRTAADDLGVKMDYYEQLGVGEYWLFDSAGEFYGFTLRGYRLEEGRYRAVAVREISPGVVQAYSAALNLNLRVADGCLGWHDPATGAHIPTLQSQTARAEAEHAARIRETDRAEAEHAARIRETDRAETAEARVQELEAEIRQLRESR